jgi:hypothetical protein
MNKVILTKEGTKTNPYILLKKEKKAKELLKKYNIEE